ncbi:HalOD1 output domain-containing protein [Natrinema pallidum]|uniref:ATP-binding protein n=1 Tax=Natrinema pallidum TaxID=69527 RepID=A0A4P9TE44_9EURY|nr:HalOD1 output domain-containing protein [Natrinema pallidum]QCW03036.1 ATP-binding protein [Natrinema pallidum]
MTDFQNHDVDGADGGTPFVTERKSSETTVQAILRGITTITGVDETELDPLYDAVAVEALTALVEHGDRPIRVTFGYEGHTVVVDGDGSIRIVDDPPRNPPAGSD